MNRREFGKTGLSGAVAAAAGGGVFAAATAKQSFYELRTYEMRNDLDVPRLNRFVESVLMPALKPRVSGPIGAFNVSFGDNTPALVLLLQYASPEALLANTDMAASDQPWVSAWKEFAESGIPYLHYKSQLLKAFAAHPTVQKPSGSPDGRVFELRTYESKDAFKSAAKIDMFNQEEMKIFRDCNMATVFFGEALIGQRLPHLTYMLAFENMDARQRGWAAFGSNPDWNRIKNDKRWIDSVSSIHASFLSATRYSEIR
jgi:hypothetical protein